MSEGSNVLSMSSPTANMFGCEPCPKCRAKYRYLPKRPDGALVIRCDDCGFEEPALTPNKGREQR
jgi:hypothetical protein